ncbi:hypothetical protein Vau01_123810 [Virgisporangium aurantiacum]|uniref:Uncharacterized protein n=2 Tax=Virgisporangium aurantiacum TaxID=175570 RepID=A0A8J3ZNU9_9ACTN|nr:hypothetical protein Vau01_123810 [Virgisporangium aurantiacum]
MVAAASGSALIYASYTIVDKTPWAETLRGVGQGTVASVIVYVLISLFADPVRQRLQMRETAIHAIDIANEQFQQRFEAALPVAVFESAKVPKPAFREAFVELLSGSTRYDVKSSAAEFTSFRLAMGRHRREFRRLDQVRICMLDPRADEYLVAHAQLALREAHTLITSDSIQEAVNDLRTNIFVSLAILFDIRDSVRTLVYFYADLPWFRCEMFDDGMFLTYYLDGVDYPENLLFSKTARPYRAYHAGMELTRRFATSTLAFSTVGSSRDLVNSDENFIRHIRDLGCTASLEELRRLRDERFTALKKDLRSGGIDENQLF